MPQLVLPQPPSKNTAGSLGHITTSVQLQRSPSQQEAWGTPRTSTDRISTDTCNCYYRLLHPERDHILVGKWDTVILCLLVYTALVTPFEVALIDPDLDV